MASILDYDSIDLIIRHFPLADIDRHLEASKSILSELNSDDPLRPWWQRKVNDLKFAQELSEWCILNDVPTVDIKPETKTRERGLYALEKCRELEYNIKALGDTLQGYMKFHKNEHSVVKKRGNYKYK